jgi:hypothetical protein
VVVNSVSNTVSVLLGKGDGTLQDKVDYPVGATPDAISVADVNADQRPDLVVTNSASGLVSVLFGNGDGTFQPRLDYPTDAMPGGVAVADVNNDGHLDLAVTSLAGADKAGAGNVSVLLATCLQ